MDVFSVAAGVAGALGAYFLYLAATKGLPTAWAWLKAHFSVAAVRADLASLESGAVAAVKADVAAVKTDVAAIKVHVGLPVVAVPAPAPAAAV